MGELQLEDEGSREREDRSDWKVFFYVCEATFRLLRPQVGNSHKESIFSLWYVHNTSHIGQISTFSPSGALKCQKTKSFCF